MATTKSKYARNDQVRAHLFLEGVGTATPDPLYFSCLGMEGITDDRGETTQVEEPDPDRYGEFVQVDGIPGQKSRPTTSMTTRMPIGIDSPLSMLRDTGRGVNILLSRGACSVPTDYNSFDELLVMEDVQISSFSTSTISAIDSEGREPTTESADMSMKSYYKIYNLVYGLVAAPSEAGAAPKGIFFAPSWCSDGVKCGIMFAASAAKLWFVSKGVATSTAIADIAGIAPLGNRVLVAVTSVGFKLVSYTKNGVTAGGTTDRAVAGIGVISALATNGRVGLCSSVLDIFQFENAGLTSITTTDVSSLVIALETAIADVSVSPDGIMVAIGTKGSVMYSQLVGEWVGAVIMPGVGCVGSAICAISLETWLVGNTDGVICLTSDSGATWTTVLDVTGTVNDIFRVTDHLVFAAIGSSLYRSVDGGASWMLEPNVAGKSFVSLTSANKLAVCPDNPNNLALLGVTGAAMRVVTGRPTGNK